MSRNLLMDIEQALGAVDQRDVRRDAPHAVWHLRDSGLLGVGGNTRRRAIETCKHRLIELLAETGCGYLSHPDNPADYDAKGPWVHGEFKTTPLPSTLDLSDAGTQHWLFALGNWRAYVAAAPVHEGWPDPARTKASALLAWMSAAGIRALVDSFHDDVSWVIAVNDRLAA